MTQRQECLQHFIVFGHKHFDFLVAEYISYYNELRPHQALGNKPLSGEWPEVVAPIEGGRAVICCRRLGGLLKHYERAA